MELPSVFLFSSCLAIAWGHVPVSQPYFLNPALDLKATENDTVWLPCNVQHLGDNVVRWWRGDTLLADTSDHSHPRPSRMRLWLNNTLEISPISRTDTGEYVCQVVRKEPWNPMQLQHKLTVHYPPKISQEPASGEINAKLNSRIEMACRAEGEPTPKVTWQSQTGEIDNENEKAHVLVVSADSRTMPSPYTCVADNGVGQSATAQFHLRVSFTPEVIMGARTMYSAPGMQAALSCEVIAQPAAQVNWLHEGQVIDSSSSWQRVAPHTNGPLHILHIKNITAEDFGNYTCQAVNSEGSTDGTVELTGRARPASFKWDVPIHKDSAQLIWHVDSYSPIIDYTLKFRQIPAPDYDEWISIIVPADGQSPGPIHTKSYHLSGLEEAATYQAVVYSRNKYGLSTSSGPYAFATEGAVIPIKGPNQDEYMEKKIVFQSETGPIEENSISIQQEAIKFSRNGCATNTAINGLSYLTIAIFLANWTKSTHIQ